MTSICQQMPQKVIVIHESGLMLNIQLNLESFGCIQRQRFKWCSIKNHHSSTSDVTTCARTCCRKPFSSTMQSYIYKRSFKLNLSRSSSDIPGLRGVREGPSHSGNICCGQTNQYSRSAFCVQKNKDSSRLLSARIYFFICIFHIVTTSSNLPLKF